MLDPGSETRLGTDPIEEGPDDGFSRAKFQDEVEPGPVCIFLDVCGLRLGALG